MFHTKNQMKINYPMAAPFSGPPPSQTNKSRGHALFDRQAQLHANDPDRDSTPSHTKIEDIPRTVSFLRSASSTQVKTNPHSYSPLVMPRRLPLIPSESSSHSDQHNVQLLSIQPRPEMAYIKEIEPTSLQSKPTDELLETDFPLHENVTDEQSIPNEIICTAIVEQAFDYLKIHDDDDDVIHEHHENDDDDVQQYQSDSFEEDNDDDDGGGHHDDRSIETIDLPGTINNLSQTLDSGVHTESSFGTHEKLSDQPSNMACSSRGTISEEYNSESESSSHEDDEQVNHQDSITEQQKEEEAQILLLQQEQLLSRMVQEWLRKEELYCNQLQIFYDQCHQNPEVREILKKLLDIHKKVQISIENLTDYNHQLTQLITRMTDVIDQLVSTIMLYDSFMRVHPGPIRKSLEKRWGIKDLSIDDLLSFPAKQFIEITAQVQDLYSTVQSCEAGDQKSIDKLYELAQLCKQFRNRNDEEINKIILKTEDVAMKTSRGNRDHCRLILYSDVIVCSVWKAKLLASPKYTLVWFIPVIDLKWTLPEDSTDDSIDTGDSLKTHLKSAYKELERTPKSSNTNSSRLSKNIRKQESEYNLAQSKLPLILSSESVKSNSWTMLFSSNYQRQDWIDFIERTKTEFLQRATVSNDLNTHRLSDSIIQKRLDIVKQSSHELISSEFSTGLRLSPQSTQIKSTSKTYSGTLQITIHQLRGPALRNPLRGSQTMSSIAAAKQTTDNYEYFVAVEIDSYNTFYPYARTAKQTMQQPDVVEFKGEVFQVELEYSLAFRLMIHRINPLNSSSANSLDRIVCIGKFHRDIEGALEELRQKGDSGSLIIESRSGDLRVKISLKYSKRDGTFKRQPSKRSQAVFGKSIQQLTAIPSRLIDGIPRIIVKCIEIVDRDGLTETGIYRVCCVTSDLQKLRQLFDRNYQEAESLLAQKNVHVAANLLKSFFRDLPEPLFTSSLYKGFTTAIQLSDIDNQRLSLLQTMENLPDNHKKILFYLLDHLIRVSENSKINMMHLDNLAVVFGPTLMRPSGSNPIVYSAVNNQRGIAIHHSNGQSMPTDLDQMSSELQGSMQQCQVVLACLKLRRDGILK